MKLLFEHVCDASVERVFAFHQDPNNLAVLLRDWPSFQMVSNGGQIGVGSVTRVRERVGIVWFPMTFEHFLYDPPRRFGERQVSGPFERFEHVHEFERAGSRTIVRDVIEVVLPWYLGGDPGTRLLVAPRLRRFFAYRHREIDRLLGKGVG